MQTPLVKSTKSIRFPELLSIISFLFAFWAQRYKITFNVDRIERCNKNLSVDFVTMPFLIQVIKRLEGLCMIRAEIIKANFLQLLFDCLLLSQLINR